MNQKIKPAEIVMLVSGAAAFLLTLPYAHWYTFDNESQLVAREFGIDELPDGLSAWSMSTDWTFPRLFPIATYIPLIGLLLGAHIVLARFANVQFPPRALGFGWPQIHFVLAVFAGLIAVGYLFAGTERGISWGLGFWMGLLAAIGMITGAIMELVDERKGIVPGGYMPGPGMYPPRQF